MKTKLFKPNVPKPIKKLTWPQAKARFPKLKAYGDADNDGVKNYKDCKPFDIKRQGEDHDESSDYGFKFVYGINKKVKKVPTAEELIDELD